MTDILMPIIEKDYPNLAAWLLDGWLEVGPGAGAGSFIRLLNEDGPVWAGKPSYPSLDTALSDAEAAARALFEADS